MKVSRSAAAGRSGRCQAGSALGRITVSRRSGARQPRRVAAGGPGGGMTPAEVRGVRGGGRGGGRAVGGGVSGGRAGGAGGGRAGGGGRGAAGRRRGAGRARRARPVAARWRAVSAPSVPVPPVTSTVPGTRGAAGS